MRAGNHSPSRGGAAARGVVGAMAMTGLRLMTTGLGLLRKTPPDELATEAVPALLAMVPPAKRDEAIELAHWAFGAAASVGYTLLPAAVRRRSWAGPAYGLAIWAAYEAVVTPLLDRRRLDDRTARDRIALALDHALYGAVIRVEPDER